jgi:tetratricopeptide (TPR) repeat protein
MSAQNLASQAIKAALAEDWRKAAGFNLQLIKTAPGDLDALLRLGKAYEELCKFKKAVTTYRKVIKQDRFNPIAKRALERLKKCPAKKSKNNKKNKITNRNFFLEEPGKTKTVSLIRLASPKKLLELDSGEEVKFIASKRSISVRDCQNNYLGRVPDDVACRLCKLIKRGNSYCAVVKAVDKKLLQIFIKEEKRSRKNQDIPSFISPGEHYHTFLPKEAIAEAD